MAAAAARTAWEVVRRPCCRCRDADVDFGSRLEFYTFQPDRLADALPDYRLVREVGKGVTSLKPGDHVIPLYTPECRECEYCLNPKTNLCQKIRSTQGAGVMPDGSSRFTLNGEKIFHSPSAKAALRAS